MDAISLGPLLLPYSRLPGVLALILLLLVSEILDKKHPGLARWGWMTAVVGGLGGRLAFAAMTPTAYVDEPWTLAYFWQPGYSWWGALLAAVLFSVWYWRKHPALRTSGLILLGASSLVGLLTLAVLPRTDSDEQLPELLLHDLDSEEVNLSSYQGQPLVVNLWATWCPPCRREMPMLESYENDERLQVVLVNQGESLLAVTNYLQDEQLSFTNVLLDPAQKTMNEYSAPGLPATLFYSAEGKLVDRHFGELSRGQVEEFARRHSQGLDK
jgi:thiol-disulfide isomerase/thioredoxin